MTAGPQLSIRPNRLRPVLSRAEHVEWAARALEGGAVVAHGFANFYAITTRADRATVRRVNELKGRPADQVGSVTAPPQAIHRLWDFSRLPSGWDRGAALRVMDTFFRLGPFGFRGPAAADVPDHLSRPVAGVHTVQLIVPGYSCPSNALLGRALELTGDDFLYITSANRSHHLTGADDSPAHWKAAGLLAEFGDEPDFVVLEHDNEDLARQRYPHFLPMSTTILGFGPADPRTGRSGLVLERRGSLSTAIVRRILDDLGIDLTVGSAAGAAPQPREYLSRLCDRLPGGS